MCPSLIYCPFLDPDNNIVHPVGRAKEILAFLAMGTYIHVAICISAKIYLPKLALQCTLTNVYILYGYHGKYMNRTFCLLEPEGLMHTKFKVNHTINALLALSRGYINR